MAVNIKYDVSGADHDGNASGGGEFVQAPKGVYIAELTEANLGYSKDNDGKPDKTRPRVECIYSIVAESDGSKPAAQYSRIWDYVSFSDAAEWKLDMFLQSFGIATKQKEKGQLDLTRIAGKVTDMKGATHDGKAAKVKVRVAAGKDLQGDYRAKIGGTYLLVDEAVEELNDDIESAMDDEELIEDDEEAEEEAEADYTAEDIDGMPAADLKALVKEEGFTVKKGMKVAEVRELVKEELGLNEVDELDDDDLPF